MGMVAHIHNPSIEQDRRIPMSSRVYDETIILAKESVAVWDNIVRYYLQKRKLQRTKTKATEKYITTQSNIEFSNIRSHQIKQKILNP